MDAMTQEYAQKTFLIFDGRRISYQEFARDVKKSSSLLAKTGIKKGSKIALLMENSPEYLYLFFGCMRMGAVVCPISTRLSEREIGYLLSYTDSAFLFYDDDQAEKAKDFPAMATSEFARKYPFEEEDLTPGNCRPEDDCIMVFSSGTTGNPKGIVITHRNFLVHHAPLVKALELSGLDIHLCILPITHVAGLFTNIMNAFSTGATVVLERKFSRSGFWPTIRKYNVTYVQVVPTILTMLLNPPDMGESPKSLRFVGCASAPLPKETIIQFEAAFSVHIVESYGLSETTCKCLVNSFSMRKFASIGKPMSINEVEIRNDKGQRAPDGTIGEIAVRGPNIMKEYYKDLKATEESIRDGWFYSGDLGYRDSEGYFFITGRKKEVIIRGGEKISPKAVNEILYRYPKVRDAATIGVPDPVFGEEVVSFVTQKEGQHCTAEEIVAHCEKYLARFECPKEIIFIEEIPKGPSGKLLGRELQEIWKCLKTKLPGS